MPVSQDEVKSLFETMQQKFNADKAQNMDAVIQFNLTGEENAHYWLHVQDSAVKMGEGEASEPRMTLIATAEDFADVVHGRLNAMQSFMSGKLKVKGDMGLAMRLQSIFSL
jgi:putative sterol carrier protein